MTLVINIARSRGRYKSITQRVERSLIRHALQKTGSCLAASKYLGIARGTLRTKMDYYKLSLPR